MHHVFLSFVLLYLLIRWGQAEEAAKVLYQFTTPNVPTAASATMVGPGSVSGTIRFTQPKATSLVSVTGAIYGLAPGWHGMHIAQFGNISQDCEFVGGHFNVDRLTHGSPTEYKRHAGDLGNIRADKDGIAYVSMVDQRVSLIGPYSVIGRSVVISKQADDMGRGGNDESLVSGNAGAPVACGLIGITREML